MTFSRENNIRFEIFNQKRIEPSFLSNWTKINNTGHTGVCLQTFCLYYETADEYKNAYFKQDVYSAPRESSL